jgi:predicted ThiF/HesA family dinucleotide-utilizing enzyme
MFGSRKDVLAVVNVNQGEKGTLQYLVLIDVKASGAVEKSIVFLGTNVEVKSIVATDLGSKTGEEYVAVVTVLDRKAGEAVTAKPTVQKTLIFTVEKGVFNIEKSISI